MMASFIYFTLGVLFMLVVKILLMEKRIEKLEKLQGVEYINGEYEILFVPQQTEKEKP